MLPINMTFVFLDAILIILVLYRDIVAVAEMGQ